MNLDFNKLRKALVERPNTGHDVTVFVHPDDLKAMALFYGQSIPFGAWPAVSHFVGYSLKRAGLLAKRGEAKIFDATVLTLQIVDLKADVCSKPGYGCCDGNMVEGHADTCKHADGVAPPPNEARKQELQHEVWHLKNVITEQDKALAHWRKEADKDAAKMAELRLENYRLGTELVWAKETGKQLVEILRGKL
jgi:hypothetical protein